MPLRGRQIAERNIHRNSFRARETPHVHRKLAVTRLGPRLDRAVVKRLALVRNHAVQIEIHGVPESLAARARAIRIVERKKPRLRFLIRRAALLAFEALVENHPLGRASGVSGTNSRIASPRPSR